MTSLFVVFLGHAHTVSTVSFTSYYWVTSMPLHWPTEARAGARPAGACREGLRGLPGACGHAPGGVSHGPTPLVLAEMARATGHREPSRAALGGLLGWR